MSVTSLFDATRASKTIDVRDLPSGATFLRILGVNYVHLKASDGGDLYLTEYGLPFREHLAPENWYEEGYFTKYRQRLEGTSAVYKVATRPVTGHICRSIDLVVKWSRVGQDVPLDTFTLNKAINAEFNTPFEEFSLVEELRNSKHGPRDLHIHMQKPLAIYAPPERMQLWQTGRSREKVLSRIARHPGIDIDILKSYILLYAWVKGYNCVETFASFPWNTQRQIQEQQSLLAKVNSDMEAKGFMVADNKPTHIILRTDKDGLRRRRNGEVMYGVIDYELLARTPQYEEAIKAQGRSRYLVLQSTRFTPPADVEYPAGVSPTNVLGVDYVYGRAESTGGRVWVVGRNPELFNYFLPERWRYKQVNLSHRRQTYYVQSKDRIHLVWEVSRVGELLQESPSLRSRYEAILRHGFNSPFEEVAYALELRKKGVLTTYPRAIYMTGQEVQLPNCVVDESRFESHRALVAPDGKPLLRLDRDYILIWGYWRGLEDIDAPTESRHLTPIDAARAAAKGLVSEKMLPEIIERHRANLAKAGYEDLTLNGEHILMSYIPEGPIKRDESGEFELRQCNFEMVRRLPT